jgi:hypothetical protein
VAALAELLIPRLVHTAEAVVAAQTALFMTLVQMAALVAHMAVAAGAVIYVVLLAALAATVLSVLSGPAQLAHSHQQTLAIFNQE